MLASGDLRMRAEIFSQAAKLANEAKEEYSNVLHGIAIVENRVVTTSNFY